MCKDIKMVVFDFDGVFTDGKFYFNETSITSKCYSAKDAYALKILKKNKIKVGIITNDKMVSIENAPHIFNRLDKYSIGQDRAKLEILDEWIKDYDLSYSDVAYIGDDLADIPVLKKVEFSGCPNDAVKDVKKVCNYICKNKGGEGAVREFVDTIIKNNNSLINKNIKEKYKYLITGGYGFLGINFIYYLLQNGVSYTDIIIIDNLSTSNININKYSFLKNISFLKGDIGSDNFINNLKFKVEVIFHFAAQSGGEGSFDDTIYNSNTNSKGTLLLLNYARRVKCNNFIFISTCAVYGGINSNKEKYSEEDNIDPNTFYAINKLSSEKYLKLYNKNYGINYTIFRLFNCYGPYQNLINMKQGMVSIFLKQILSDEYPEIIVKGNLDRTRDLVYVEDAVKIIFDSVNNSKFNNDIFNLGTGQPSTVSCLLNNLIKNLKQKKIVVKGETPGDMGKLYADNSKLQKVYNNNFKFTPLEIGIKKTCEHYLYNKDINKIKNDKKITAVIPVRKGSQRCKNKNIRNFGDTNLLKLKIETLKMVNNIDEIIVSTDCDKMIKVAKDLGVKIHKRDSYYASSECPNYEYWTHIAKNVGSYSNFMMVNCVSPLINKKTINEFIEQYKTNYYKNMITVTEHKKFFYDSESKKAINFNSNEAPNSQLLKPLSEITYGLSICNRQKIIDSQCIYGNNPEFFVLDNVSSIDIDDCSEFITSELYYNNHIVDNGISKLILDRRVDEPETVDCTIRDGGYLNNWNYTDEQVIDCYKAVTETGINYFEIGFRTNKDLLSGKGKWCYSTEDDINAIVSQYKGTKICVMAKVGTVTIDDFVEKKLSNIDMIRVLLARCTKKEGIVISKYNKQDIITAKKFCNDLIDLGYEVCFNLGCGDIIDDEEIKLIISEFHDVKIKSLYLADTYGGFNSKNIPIQLHKFYYELNKYNSKLSLGFHIHSNNGDGLEKAKIAIFNGCSMIDSSINGLGRGAGNLKTEQYICYKYGSKVNFKEKITPIITFFDKHILTKKQYNKKKIQHHPYYNIAGALSLHPNYILEILSNLDTNVNEDIDMIFKLDKYTIKNNCRNYDKSILLNI